MPVLEPCAECGELEGVEYYPRFDEVPTAPHRRLLCLRCLVPAIRAELYSQGLLPTFTPFNFTEFAESIYRENPKAHQRPFLLPALYGGEPSQAYDVLFVLEAPSVSFTQDRWMPCDTTAMAIQNHRRIFFDWAFRGRQAHLFGSFDSIASRGALLSYTDFFRRFYVTDIWKDATPKENRDRRYQEYWLAKLAIELERVAARRVIFIGREAERGRRLVQNGLPIHYIPFPGQWRTDKDCREDVVRLHEEIRAMP